VHEAAFAEGERLTDESCQPLSQRVVEPLDVIGFSFVLVDRPVMPFGNHCKIGFPEVGVGSFITIAFGYPAPEQLAGHFASIAQRVSDYLPRSAAKRQPEPHLIALGRNKRPEFIQFQNIATLRGQNRIRKVRQRRCFF
jgi:hypothetical protein